ncbi:hypothetical protein QYF61_009629 [Mycteria americana]|uniref:EGF-like domain-containing protein n=1 Tax=Mycteria americana TaxID=33587 RepID=A0AAN7N9M0_MYCAM|nr:hypothetical protein QYF61_009629 [Mycteria americana]
MDPLLKLVKVPLDGIPSFKCINCTTQLGVMCKFVEGALDPTVYEGSILYSSQDTCPLFHCLCISFLHFSLSRRSLLSHAGLLPSLPDFLHVEIESCCALRKMSLKRCQLCSAPLSLRAVSPISSVPEDARVQQGGQGQTASLPTLKQINSPTQLGVICKLTEGALNPLIQIIDKDVKQNWPQHRALGDTTCDRPPTGVNSIHHHSLGLAIQPVLYLAKSTPIQAMSSQFLQENAGTLSTSLLSRPKSALRKSKVTVLLTPLITSPSIKNSYHFMITLPKMASNHHMAHKSFSVREQEVQRGTFPRFEGTYCEVNSDECISHPCQNEGLCVDGVNHYRGATILAERLSCVLQWVHWSRLEAYVSGMRQPLVSSHRSCLAAHAPPPPTRVVFHPSDHFRGPPVDLLQQLHVFLVLRAAELDAVLHLPGSAVTRTGKQRVVRRKGVAQQFARQFTQVSEPTREGAPLDLLFTNREGLVSHVTVGDCLGQSDHEMIEFLILGEVMRGVSKTVALDFRRADFGLFRRLVDGVPWEAALKGKGVQEGWIFFKEEVLKAQEQAVPRC